MVRRSDAATRRLATTTLQQFHASGNLKDAEAWPTVVLVSDGVGVPVEGGSRTLHLRAMLEPPFPRTNSPGASRGR
jgi:hypothetical protein